MTVVFDYAAAGCKPAPHFLDLYSFQPKDFHHEEHEGHEEKRSTPGWTGVCSLPGLRALGALRGFIFLISIVQQKLSLLILAIVRLHACVMGIQFFARRLQRELPVNFDALGRPFLE